IGGPDLPIAAARGKKREAFAIGRPARAAVAMIAVGDLAQARSIRRYYEEMLLLLGGVEREPFAVGREGRPRGALGRLQNLLRFAEQSLALGIEADGGEAARGDLLRVRHVPP